MILRLEKPDILLFGDKMVPMGNTLNMGWSEQEILRIQDSLHKRYTDQREPLREKGEK